MAVERIAVRASDPSVDGALLAWHEPGARGILVRDGGAGRVAGAHPAVGGARLAVIGAGSIGVSHTSGPAFALTVPAPGADAVAVSAGWLAWRAREYDGDVVYAAPLAGGEPRRVMSASELGRPALDGERLVFHVAGSSSGRIVLADLAAGVSRTVRRERRAQLLNPSLLGDELLYVRSIYRRQEVRVGSLTQGLLGRDRRLWQTVPAGRRDAGHEPGVRHHRHGHPRTLWRRPREGVAATLWTTALAADAAYLTRLRQQSGKELETEILRLPR